MRHLGVSAVEHEPPRRIEHRWKFGHVVERRCNLVLLTDEASDGEQPDYRNTTIEPIAGVARTKLPSDSLGYYSAARRPW
jgi:hypothetical protein